MSQSVYRIAIFSAEFLNEWMKEDSDELIDKFFEEIKDRQEIMNIFMSFFMR